MPPVFPFLLRYFLSLTNRARQLQLERAGWGRGCGSSQKPRRRASERGDEPGRGKGRGTGTRGPSRQGHAGPRFRRPNPRQFQCPDGTSQNKELRAGPRGSEATRSGRDLPRDPSSPSASVSLYCTRPALLRGLGWERVPGSVSSCHSSETEPDCTAGHRAARFRINS